ncbi:hypothetical protein ITJ66_14105 [Plantibacter sp. VKM Ac-2885]|uniref:hypothetical protein n=1 Tax=Plantibacter sp. VKM Ac-2885 TaxID=2783828 RepID=UPI00188DA41B|nr:hypothetical protein [Plantibacter sp. VKM Ac-2885]MBF4513619.1 hypothetical protein [Plantibacter sp. VKM Ac-2885]
MISERRIVLCGSMRAFEAMLQVRNQLAEDGITAILPDEDCVSIRASAAQLEAHKRDASLRHFSCIQEDQTAAILVVNIDKDGARDYIGPNSFAEIAVAFAAGRAVYLLQSIPSQYEDELRAWGVRELRGEISRFRTEYWNNPSLLASA